MTDTIGKQLKRARQEHNLTLEQAAEATRIRAGYLQALETDDYSAMPSPVHARGFLRNYAQYLHLDLDRIVEELRLVQQEKGAEPEVQFVGEQTALPSAWEGIQPKLETGEAPVEAPAEPFWQTWLRRAKKEVGEPDGMEPAANAPAHTDQDGGRPASPEKYVEQPTVPAPDPRPKTEAGQKAANGTIENGAKAELLIDRMRALVPRRQARTVPAATVVEKPEARPEPEPELAPEVNAEPGTSSQEIINEIAQQLRRRREMLSLSLDEIERHTRLRVEIMEALESGSFEDLPSPVQTRGMLANYAGFLDLEVEALLLRYADALQARHRERHPVKPARRRGPVTVPESLPPFRTFIAGDVVFGLGMILLLIGFSVWGISRVISYQSEQSGAQAEANGPSISEALIGTPEETVAAEVTLIPAEDTPIPELPEGTQALGDAADIPALESSANVQVNIVALERSFLRVMVDGEVTFEGRTIPGNAYPFEAEESVEVLAGNGAALRVIYNQRDMGLLGGFGQVASFIYTAEEVLVPTPAMSPTVTNTPFISPTPSITPSPTVTPSPTNTPSDIGVEA